MAEPPPVKRRGRALLSVTDKTGLADLAAELIDHDFELIASGGTARHLREHGCDVIDVSEVTGFPEIFGGRVKTLHPLIHGGILAPREEDFDAVAELGIGPIDVACVNLYRFEESVHAGGDPASVVEQIDIGGPALLRAAAKNFDRVAVLSAPDQYPEFCAALRDGHGSTSVKYRRSLAAAAFALVADYEAAIAAWFGEQAGAVAPACSGVTLRYGENPHQQAWLEVNGERAENDPLAACGIEQLGGKQLSYNNLVDLVAALKLVCDFEESCCAVIKHTNPCGFGLGPARAATERSLLSDPVSAFGGVFAYNAPVDADAAEILHGRFLEIVAAPDFAPAALDILRKKKNVRLVRYDRSRFLTETAGQSRGFGRFVLTQEEDAGFSELEDWRVVSGVQPESAQARALRMAWKVCKHVKSNAIVLADADGILGVGAGQMSRVDSVTLAINKAVNQQLPLAGAVAASDGFFPFPDGIQKLQEAGITAVVAPGGSIRDDEVAAAARELDLTLVLTSRRHFRH